MGDEVNIFIDNLISLTWRLLDLPLYFLLIICLLVILISYLVLKIIQKRTSYRNSKNKIFRITSVFLLLIAIALIIDHKFMIQKKETNNIYNKFTKLYHNYSQLKNKCGTFSTSNKSDTCLNKHPGKAAGVCDHKKKWGTDLYEPGILEKGFSAPLEITEQSLSKAIYLLSIKKEDPKAKIFIAIIDLKYKDLAIVITPEFKEKYLTSTFARTNNCDVAINGEAGETMHPGCNLGEWTGNWIVNGKPVLLEDSEKRPFLSFDRNNKARYYSADIIDTIVTVEKYNTIWGRHDILLNGDIKHVKNNKPFRPYCRTVMGINNEGTRLFLMVVDGKRPDYSLGLTYEESALMLKLLGADHAMACDQGGSSCMYIKDIDGIINRPADSDGRERMVYTHFGVRVN